MKKRVKKSRYRISKAEIEIIELLNKKGYEVIGQYHIEGLPYLYDFYLPEYNLVLEYYGDFFHANPNKYAADTLLKMPGVGAVRVEHIWDKDELKRRAAEKLGFTVRYVWETDYKLNGWKSIKKCLK